ncbi:MAG: hypothetical protein GQ477_03150 [Nanohaloarchaea archaeon]|nr:hypothetical protein [Candidatus Nanohaloarchaea archaeon]
MGDYLFLDIPEDARVLEPSELEGINTVSELWRHIIDNRCYAPEWLKYIAVDEVKADAKGVKVYRDHIASDNVVVLESDEFESFVGLIKNKTDIYPGRAFNFDKLYCQSNRRCKSSATFKGIKFDNDLVKGGKQLIYEHDGNCDFYDLVISYDFSVKKSFNSFLRPFEMIYDDDKINNVNIRRVIDHLIELKAGIPIKAVLCDECVSNFGSDGGSIIKGNFLKRDVDKVYGYLLDMGVINSRYVIVELIE